jgi:hypothetical protein
MPALARLGASPGSSLGGVVIMLLVHRIIGRFVASIGDARDAHGADRMRNDHEGG